MTIDELKYEHFNVNYAKNIDPEKDHTNISLQFAIELLEEIKIHHEAWDMSISFVEHKINELKKLKA